jgi:hypothetical protein
MRLADSLATSQFLKVCFEYGAVEFILKITESVSC